MDSILNVYGGFAVLSRNEDIIAIVEHCRWTILCCPHWTMPLCCPHWTMLCCPFWTMLCCPLWTMLCCPHWTMLCCPYWTMLCYLHWTIVTSLLRPRETVSLVAPRLRRGQQRSGRGATKLTVFPRSQYISVLLYSKCPRLKGDKNINLPRRI